MKKTIDMSKVQPINMHEALTVTFEGNKDDMVERVCDVVNRYARYLITNNYNIIVTNANGHYNIRLLVSGMPIVYGD